ncbi:MAG: DUF4307 domain-containing protein [Austwickia sp.]|nr:MAG: DUF4307 domain-containing protein [Austwickia sp.]
MRIPRPAPGRAKIWLLATVTFITATVIAVWWGLSATLTKPTWQSVTWEIRDDRAAVATYTVNKPKDMTVLCVVEALGMDHALVGSREVTLGAADQRELTYQTEVRTTARAVSAKLRNCREIAPS